MCPKKPTKETRRDHSAVSRLVQDFGLLLIDDEFQRYLENNRLQKQALREGRIADFRSLEELHAERFVPLLPLLGLELSGNDDAFRHFEVVERLSQVEKFVKVLTRTTDFKLEIRELHKRLKRKFAGRNEMRLSYRTERLISEKLVGHCRDLMWIVSEFHVPDEEDEWDFLWDVNLWTVILDAHELHQKTGMVHFAFVEYLKSYQERRGGGSPRVYRQAALAILLAECFEDFNQLGRKPQINDQSDKEDREGGFGKLIAHRKPFYASAFADFLIKFCEIIELDEIPRREDHSLDKYRQMLRERVNQNIPRISERISSGLGAAEVVELLNVLDRVKR